jgi:NAD(P)-dependent dehydrogenase (short-subunit alcohol dehydrogenase family)
MSKEDFSDQVVPEKVIITGGTEGIGRALARELSAEKHKIVICARTRERLAEVAADSRVKAFQLDLSETAKIKDFVEQGEKSLGGLTVLILNAAVTGIRETPDYTFKVVRDAQRELVESAAPALRATGGRIVFMTSAQAKKFIPGHEYYGQAKKDVEDWLREFSAKPENNNIQIILVNPGHVDTRMNEEAINYGQGAIRERSINAKEAGKFRDPQIVGRIIAQMAIAGKKFNPETKRYDIPIENNEIVAITDENVQFEENLSK